MHSTLQFTKHFLLETPVWFLENPKRKAELEVCVIPVLQSKKPGLLRSNWLKNHIFFVVVQVVVLMSFLSFFFSSRLPKGILALFWELECWTAFGECFMPFFVCMYWGIISYGVNCIYLKCTIRWGLMSV